MTNNIPPKQTPTPPVGADARVYEQTPPLANGLADAPHGALVSFHDPALHGEAGAFPVLKAFQDYLETERQQARKRLVTLTAFFVCLMSLVVGGFIVAFIFLFNRMSQQQDARQEAAARMQETLLQAALQPRVAPPAPAPAIEAVAQRVEAATVSLQTNLGARLNDVGDAAQRLNAKFDAQSNDVSKLQAALAAMQKENKRLRDEMPRMALEAARKLTPPPPPSALVDDEGRAAPPSDASAAITAGAAIAGAAIAAPPSANAGVPLKGYREALLKIRGSKSNEPISWRVFIPE